MDAEIKVERFGLTSGDTNPKNFQVHGFAVGKDWEDQMIFQGFWVPPLRTFCANPNPIRLDGEPWFYGWLGTDRRGPY